MLLAPLKRGKRGLQKPFINIIIITIIIRHVVGSRPMKRKKKE